ncbi:hypothetical protein BD779DRAFT_1696027 [Infundibulicybe gibba]|nr:hypothetical protein BD779DRAFT_1696027 [Infundibulicybe gibba]
MDIFSEARHGLSSTRTIDMHTSGEPTRIVIDGWGLEGSTLLEKRTYAQNHGDRLRKRLVLEPRGHAEMYGALLADIGVLFFHNDGYSTMCGHATIALGRFLIDTHDLGLFPRREELVYSPTTGITEIRLHAPCGVVQVSVPTTNGRSDGSKPVSFLSVPSFPVAIALKVEIPVEKRWGMLQQGGRSEVEVDIAYGGAFYAVVSAAGLGFPQAPQRKDLEYLYGVMITEGEVGLCYFADMQVDRSPTGSCVSAQVALAVEKGQLQIGESRKYESFWFSGNCGREDKGRVIVRVEGKAFYTGQSIFYVEDGDNLPDGFVFQPPK